jgi:hypothetical protein
VKVYIGIFLPPPTLLCTIEHSLTLSSSYRYLEKYAAIYSVHLKGRYVLKELYNEFTSIVRISFRISGEEYEKNKRSMFFGLTVVYLRQIHAYRISDIKVVGNEKNGGREGGKC